VNPKAAVSEGVTANEKAAAAAAAPFTASRACVQRGHVGMLTRHTMHPEEQDDL
jgi:hypothetical protein